MKIEKRNISELYYKRDKNEKYNEIKDEIN